MKTPSRCTRWLLTILAMTACTCLAACEKQKESAAAPAADNRPVEGTIVALGDSLTAGYGLSEANAYPALLEKKLHQAGYRWRVVNAGISGETSSGTLARLDWVLKLKPEIVILEIGANDGFRGIEPRLLQKNIEEITTALEAKGVLVVLAGMKMLTNLGPAYTREFAAVYPRVAAKHHLILIPFFLSGVAGDASLNQADTIHPTAKGYRIVTEKVYPYVLQAIDRKRRGKAGD